jgi:hypothetical protein
MHNKHTTSPELEVEAAPSGLQGSLANESKVNPGLRCG